MSIDQAVMAGATPQGSADGPTFRPTSDSSPFCAGCGNTGSSGSSCSICGTTIEEHPAAQHGRLSEAEAKKNAASFDGAT